MLFIILMFICNLIVFIPIFIWFLIDTKEVRRLNKISKEINKKRN